MTPPWMPPANRCMRWMVRKEPTLGDWMPAGQQSGVWVNKGIRRIRLMSRILITRFTKLYAGEEDALNAFQRKDVDEILESGGCR